MRVRVYLYLVKYACETKRVGVVPTDCFVSFHRVCVCVCVCVREREREFISVCMYAYVWEKKRLGAVLHGTVSLDSTVYSCVSVYEYICTHSHNSTTATSCMCDYACCFIIVAL